MYGSVVKPNGPAYSIVGRKVTARKVDGSPGPGMYNSKLKTGLAFSFGKKIEVGADTDAPGPGAYSYKPSVPDIAHYAIKK